MGDDIRKTPEVAIVIPHRMTEDAETTLRSLEAQTFRDFETIVVPDEGQGANWARNRGFEQSSSPFVLFSDNDITWRPHALETMLRVLKMFPGPAYCYGRYIMYSDGGPVGGTVWSHQAFDSYVLKDHNYISTMALWRANQFPGFDESVQRLQDWDVYLTALEQGKRGVYCEDLVFTSRVKPGITHGGPDIIEWENKIRAKHGLKLIPAVVVNLP